MRGALALLGLAMATMSHAAHRAVLVGIDRYPVLGPTNQLAGAASDLRLMGMLAQAYGFGPVTTLSGAKATRSEIVAQLDREVAAAKAGDTVLFYFSGRGGRAREKDNPELIPTLVPIDGQRNSGANDVSMTVLEQWATKIADKGATPVLIFDACWTQLDTRSVEAKPFNPQPRYFNREPRVLPPDAPVLRSELIRSPALVLSASSPTGSAYEWKLDLERWGGAFTSMLVNTLSTMTARELRTTAREAVAVIRREAVDRAQQGYMPGFEPLVSGPGDDLLFGKRMTLSTEGPLGQLLADVRKQAKTLRITIDVDDEIDDVEARRALYAAVAGPLRTYLRTKLDAVTFAEPMSAMPDRVILLSGKPGALEVRLRADEQRTITREAQVLTGASITEILDEDLAARLQRDAYVVRLYRLLDAESPTGAPTADALSFPKSLKLGDPVKIGLKAPVNARGYLLNRDDLEGALSLVFPNFREPEIIVGPEGITLPRAGNLAATRPLGMSELRLLLVEDRDLPPLPRATDRTQFRTALIDHLKALVKALEEGSLKWWGTRVRYEILPR